MLDANCFSNTNDHVPCTCVLLAFITASGAFTSTMNMVVKAGDVVK